MTDDEAEETSIIYLLGFAKGREFERNLIRAWLRKNGKPQIADAVEAKEHLE